MTTTPGQNYNWDEERTACWLAHAAEREAQLAPVADRLFASAGLRPGQRVLDVGCGNGITTFAATRRVRPGGRVIGVDISPGMIRAARAVDDEAAVYWVCADAATPVFAAGSFDAVISRFGVMFFADPVTAFSRLATACRPGAGLTLAVWGERDAAGMFAIPYRIVTETLNQLGARYQPMPADAGPFSLGRPDRTEQLLRAAGWRHVDWTSFADPLYLGGPGTAEHAVEAALDLGPVRTVLEGQPAEVTEAVRDCVLAEFTARHDGIGVGLPGGFVIVSARLPA